MTTTTEKETRGIASAALSFAASTYEQGKGYLPSVVATNLELVEQNIVSRVGDITGPLAKLDSVCDSAVDYVEKQDAYKSVVALPATAEDLVERYLPAEDEDEEEKVTSAFLSTVSRRVKKRAFKGLNDLQLRAKDVVHVDLIAYANSLDKENYIGTIKDKTNETIEIFEEKLVVPAREAYTEWVLDELSGKPSLKKVMSVVGETYDERVAPVVNEYKDTTIAYYKEKNALVQNKFNETYEFSRVKSNEIYSSTYTALMSAFTVLSATMDPYMTPAKNLIVDYLTLLNAKVTNFYNPLSEKLIAFYTKQFEASLELYKLAIANEKVVAAKDFVMEYYGKAMQDERFAKAQKKAQEIYSQYFVSKVKDE